MSHSERELARERCKTLAGFIREFFPLLHPGQPYVHSWNIDFLCAHLEAITFGNFLALGLSNRLLANVIDELAEKFGDTPALLSERETLTFRALSEPAHAGALPSAPQGPPDPAKAEALSAEFARHGVTFVGPPLPALLAEMS